MAAELRPGSDALDTLQRIAEAPYEADFYALLRFLECMHADKPRLGEAARPNAEPVRLGQQPSLAFAPSTLAYFRPGDRTRPHRVGTYFFGLFGPHGPLPLHLTEYAHEREHHSDDPTWRRFADLFHHRLLLLFYRAWANANPVTSLDRPDDRRFDHFVGSVSGVGMDELQKRDTLPETAKYYLAGLLALRTRPAKVLLSLLVEFMQLPFQLEQFRGAWMRLPADDWFRLGGASGSRLGVDTVLGSSVWSCQHRFRLVCGPLGFADFQRLLPGRDSLDRLRDLVRQYLGDEYEWDVNLVLRKDEVPELRLGVSGELGWTSWLGQRQVDDDADEVVVQPVSVH